MNIVVAGESRCRRGRARVLVALVLFGALLAAGAPATASAVENEETGFNEPPIEWSSGEPEPEPAPLTPPPTAPTDEGESATASSTMDSTITANDSGMPDSGTFVPAATTGPLPIPGGLWDTNPEVAPGQTYVAFSGTPGESISGGQSYLYTKADAEITLSESGGLTLNIRGDRSWAGGFSPPSGTSFSVGLYQPADVLWSGGPGNCGGATGWVAVDQIERSGGAIQTLVLRFNHQCPDATGSISGKIRWVASDSTVPPGPLPVPAGLWDTTPAVGPGQSYVALDGLPGNYITQGRDHLYTKADSILSVTQSAGRVDVSAAGYEVWAGEFSAMIGVDPLAPGYYSGLRRNAFRDPAKGGLEWSGESRGCNVSDSWFAVDEVSYVSGTLSSLTLRFFQGCDGDPGLYGKVRWLASDPTLPPAPEPIPEDLWDTTPAVPAGRSYVALQGSSGDVISQGRSYLYTKQDSALTLTGRGVDAAIDVRGDEYWYGEFAAMYTIDELRVGYYPNAQRTQERSPTAPGVTWRGEGRDCTLSGGWLAVDEITRGPAGITSLTLRFSQTCDGGPPLYGKLRWVGSDATVPPGVQPVPDDLWDAELDLGGDYVYLEGASGDPMSRGEDLLYTPVFASLSVAESGRSLNVGVNSDESWFGHFRAMDSQSRLEPGFYPGLQKASSANPVKGGLDWFRASYLCASVTGWLAVDEIVRVNGAITRLQLRFEQSCDGAPAMHGKVVLGAPTPSLPGGSPVGRVEAVAAVPGGFGIIGWAIDPDTASPILVDVYVDGGIATVAAAAPRPDVGAAYPGYGNAHGIAALIALDPGTYAVCAVARNHGVGQDLGLGCRWVTVLGGSPIGSLDSVRAVPGAVTVGGWAFDPDTVDPASVHVYVGSKGKALTADGNRADVGAVYPGYGPSHGFTASIPTPPGTHQVCAYGINVASGANVLLGCRTVTVPGGSPFGSLDSARGVPGGVVVGGWAIDPDTAASIPVHVYAGSKGVALTASGSRPDVGVFFGPYGSAHGFDGFIAMPPGAHQVCAYAINVGVGATSTLACRTVVVPGGSPFGSFDVAVGGAGKVTVAGWAIDPDTSASIPVHVYVANVGTALTAGNVRNDVAAAFPGYGANHGFNATITATPGVKQVCAYGINTGVGGNSLLGCKTVTIT